MPKKQTRAKGAPNGASTPKASRSRPPSLAPSNAQQAQVVTQAVDPMAGFSNKSGADKRTTLNGLAPQSRRSWHAQMEQNAQYVATPMLDAYLGEETNQQSGGLPSNINGKSCSGTHYADSATEYGTSIQGQKLMQGAAPLDSLDARKLWNKDQQQRVNFAMDTSGGMYATDPRAEVQKHQQGQTTRRSNHSSLLGGADAAAAGSLRVSNGKVDELGDGSGHYRPAISQTHQAASHLISEGVMAPERSSVRLAGKGAGQKEILMSTMEFMSYGSEMSAARTKFGQSGDKNDLAAPEAEIRANHSRKDAMLAQLLGGDEDFDTEGVIEIVELQSGDNEDFDFDSDSDSDFDLDNDGLIEIVEL